MTTQWNEIFKKEGTVVREPQQDIPRLAELFKEKGVNKILDLCCGSGRNLIYLAKAGFALYGLDNSEAGIVIAMQTLAQNGLEAKFTLQSMTELLPYSDGFFDAVLCVQALHHNTKANIEKVAREIERVVKNGGLIFVTVPKLKNQGKTFEEIEPGTFVPLDGQEKGLPHHYFSEIELKELFKNFQVEDIHTDNLDHYCLTAILL